jgi:PAS domain S-box-containing protein
VKHNRTHSFWRSAAQCLFGGIVLALLTLVCFRLQVNPTTVALLYLIVIVLVSLTGGFVPSALVSIIAIICLDYFFTPPLFSLAMSKPLDVVALIAFLATSFVINRLVSKVSRSFQEIQGLKDEFRLVIDTTPAMVHSARPDGSLDYFNQRWLDYLGASLEEIKDWKWTSKIHPEDADAFVEKWRSSVRTGDAFEAEARVRRADGVYRWMLHRKVPLRDDRGNIIKWYGSSIDIEDRMRAEDKLRAAMSERARLSAVRAEIGMALARNDNLRGILHTCAEAMVRHLDAAFARIWTLNSEGHELELQASAGMYSRLDGRYSRIPLGELEIGLIAQERKAHLTNDVQNDPRISDKDWARDEKMTSFAGYPLVVEDRIVGVMGMFSQKPLTEGTLDTLSFVADGIAQGIERKHTEERLRRSEEALRASEESFHLIVDTIPGLVNVLTATGDVEFANQQLLDYFEKTLGELKGWASTDVVHPDDLPRVIAAWKHSLETGQPHEIEHRLRRADGVYRWFHGRALPLRDPHGRIIRWYGLVTDVEDRKQAEEELRRKEAYLAEAQRLSQTGSFGWSVSSGEIFWSDETFRIFEYDRATCKPTVDLILQRVHPEDIPLVQRTIDHASKGNDFDLEHRLLMPDGSVRHVHVMSRAARDELGNVECIGAVTDITVRKRAEQRLVVQHTVTQVLAEAATLEEATPKILQAVCECLVWDLGELWRTDRAAGVLRCVKVWHKESIEAPQFTATSRDRTFIPGIGLPGRAWSSREPAYIPDVVQDSNFPRASIAALEGLHAAFAFPILLGGEVVGVMDFFSQEIRQPEQDLLDMMATIGSQIGQFIERKRAEEELRRSEAYLAGAQQLSLTGSFGWSVSSGEIFWSKETFRIFEYDRATKPTVDLVLQRVHPEDRPLVQETIDHARQHGKAFDLEYRLLMPGGSIKYLHVVAHGIRDELDQIEFIGAVTDITATKSAEHRIQEDERELRQILDLTPQHIGVLGPDGSPLYANHAALEYFGVTIDQWRAEGSRLDLVHPDDREHFLGERKNLFLEGAPHEFEARLLRHDGKFRCFLFRLNPLKNERGHITRWYGTGTDIEDRKQAEEKVQRENVALREEIDKASMFEEIVGSAEALQKVLLQIAKVAPTDSTVLIMGETGTGKELIARAIHKRSRRSARAFVSVNCAAIPQSLIASELFGHEKGSFTGALQRRVGRFELAEGGTIFLDEIGELPSETQNALLRVLQEREFERVGGTQSIRADVRVIAATNRDLKAATAAGTFRSDLFYRLAVFPIEIPPLRERREDIRMLVEYFIDRYAKKVGKKIRGVNKKTLELLQSYPWPGNIRELQNVIERSVIVCETENFSVDESWLTRESVSAQPVSQTLFKTPVAQEKEMIEAALAETEGQVSGPTGAAAKLGIPPSTLDSKIKSLKIDKYRFKTA